MHFGVGFAAGALVALASLVVSPAATAMLALVFVAGALRLCLQHSRLVLALVLAVSAVLLALVIASSAALARGPSPLASAGPGVVSVAPPGPAIPPHRLVSLPGVRGVPRTSIRVPIETLRSRCPVLLVANDYLMPDRPATTFQGEPYASD